MGNNAEAILSISRRTRSTPFTPKVTAAGVKGYTVYNHTLLPTVFESLVADYHHLKENVQIWDVSCERQVAIRGKDAYDLLQKITPRSLEKMAEGRCFYIPVVDENGGMLNDPVALKIEENEFWVSTADSDLLLWLKGLAVGWNMDVKIYEPNVFPLAVQGPKSNDLMARVFGNNVCDLKFFRFKSFNFNGCEFIISRSGFSKQGGFEIYLNDPLHGASLWDALFEAGQDLNVRAGGPNLIERIESGLLSYGNDMTLANTPYECGMGVFCEEYGLDQCVGGKALRSRSKEENPLMISGFAIDGEIGACRGEWPLVIDGKRVGQITSATWSPQFNSNVAIGMIRLNHLQLGNTMQVEMPNGLSSATIHKLNF